MFKNLRTGLIILALIALAGTALTDELPWVHAKFVDYRIGFAGLAGLAAVCFIFFVSTIKPPRKAVELGPPVPLQVADSENEVAREIANAYATAMAMYGDQRTLNLFFNMLGDLPSYLVRIDEDIETIADAPRLRIVTRQQFLIGGASPKVLLVPLARVEKGVLLDNFRANNGSGDRIPLLSDSQRRGVLAIMLTMLVDTAMREEMGEREIANHRTTRNSVLRDLTLAVCGPGPLHRLEEQAKDASSSQQPVAEQTVARIEQALKAIKKLDISEHWQRELDRFCRQHIDYYIIIAEMDRGGETDNYISSTYSQLVPFENIAVDKQNKWRGRFGMRPSVMDIALNPFAFQAQCYHQQLAVEPGQYVFDHHLEEINKVRPVTQAELRTESYKPYVRVYRDARSNAHLYIRRQILGSSTAKASLEQLKSVVQSREIPPGAIGATATVALASAAVISFFAITHTGLGINPNAPAGQLAREQIKATLNSDVPALVLALPAFVSALIGSWLDLQRLRLTSLVTYLALGFTMFLSLGSALYFILDSNRVLPTAVTISIMGGARISTDWIWVSLMAVSITHFGFILHTLIDEWHYYAKQVINRIDKEVG